MCAQVLQRRVKSKFKSSPVLLNFGGESLPDQNLAEGAVMPQLRASLPDAYLLHSSWAFSLIKRSGGAAYRRLGLMPPASGVGEEASARSLAEMPGGSAAVDGQSSAGTTALAQTNVTQAPPPERDSSSAPPQVDLVEERARLVKLARAQLDHTNLLILTFVTSAYDELCSNFAAHMRAAGISSYLLVTFNAGYGRELRARGEAVHLHELAELRTGGSDEFASKDFFLVNSARYSVLTTLLRANVNLFSMDLDVVLLRDPRPFVMSQPFEVMLQSDARDGVSQLEHSPFLLRDRLHLDPNGAVTYVNGGVFFARGTSAVARLFEDTWSLVSQDLGLLNEQDCLNRMLLDSRIRWAPLPPALFPNGFVFFRRPLEPSGWPSLGPMMLHTNWINSIAAKRFLLKEVELWRASATPAISPTTGHRYLTYSLALERTGVSIGAQLESLRNAMLLAEVFNRTLILPRFHTVPASRASATPAAMVPHQQQSRAMAHLVGGHLTRVLTHFLEYAPLAAHFPNHVESSFLSRQWPRGVPSPQEVPLSPMDALRWHAATQNTPLLHVSLDAGFDSSQLMRIFAPSSQVDEQLRSRIDEKLSSSIRPAPELRIISEHIVSKIQSHLSTLNRQRSHSGHRFNCLYVTVGELESAATLRHAVGSLPTRQPTLIVAEDTEGRLFEERDAKQGGGYALQYRDEARLALGAGVLQPEVSRAVDEVFGEPLWASDFYPYWDAVEVLDARDGRTAAFDLVQQLVCSAASAVHGDTSSPFVAGVCRWRELALFGQANRDRSTTVEEELDACGRLVLNLS